MFEIYVRVLPIGTSFDAQLRTWAFFIILLVGGWFWIETSFEYFTDQRNPIPSSPLSTEVVLLGLITGVLLGFSVSESGAALDWWESLGAFLG